jgi:lipase ATG15
MMSCCFYKQSTHLFKDNLEQCPHHLNHTETKECCIDCYTQSLDFEESYLKIGHEFIKSIQNDPIINFDHKPTIFTGHSLGGVMATLFGIQYDKTVVTFQAPGEKHYIHHSGFYKYLNPHKLNNIYHYKHNSDSIINGNCGFTCNYAGYHINTHCHIGHICEYDSQTKLSLRESIWNHRLPYILKNILPLWETDFPICSFETNCTECEEWTYN